MSCAASVYLADRAIGWLTPRSRTRREGAGVLDRLEGSPLRIGIDPDNSGLRVGDGRDDVDVGQASREDPETGVEAAAVHDLHDHLHVVRAEEPEVARVAGQADRLAG